MALHVLTLPETVCYYRNHSLDGATLFSKLDSNKLRFNVKNEMTLICAKFDADLINIIMRPSSLGGGRILRRTPSVRPSRSRK